VQLRAALGNAHALDDAGDVLTIVGNRVDFGAY
jgi:hypothetical protein